MMTKEQGILQQFDLLIEGKLKPALSGKYFDLINPSSGDVFARVSDADTIDVQMAVSAARLAFDRTAVGRRWVLPSVENF